MTASPRAPVAARAPLAARRALAGALLAVCCALALGACGSEQDVVSTPAAKPFTVMLDFFPNADHATLYAAIAHGDFRAGGLSVTPQTPPDPAAPL